MPVVRALEKEQREHSLRGCVVLSLLRLENTGGVWK